MGKRAAPAAKATVVKKAKVEVDPAFVAVSEAVMESDQLPERVRTMLVNMMPFSLKPASDERHELQEFAVGMMEKTLNGKKQALEATVASEESTLATLKASEIQLCITDITDAEAALASAKDQRDRTKTALSRANIAESDSNATLKTLTKEQSAGEKKWEKMKEEKTSIETAFAEHFPFMKEGESTGKAHLKKLEPFLKKIDIEATLVTALPNAVPKSKDKRGTFDHLVLEELEKAFNATVEKLGAAIVAEGPAAVERQAGVEAAQADHTAKDAAKVKATADFEAAEKAEEHGEAAWGAANQAEEDFVLKLEATTTRLADARSASAMFEAGPFANFHTYKARVAAPPVVEEAPAEEAAAEEAATEEAPAEATAAA